MTLQDQPQDVLLTMCGWCHRVIGENEEHFARGAKARPESQSVFRGKEGQVVVFQLGDSSRQILAIVPKADSRAKKQGHDVVFQACSEACANSLEQKMRDELGRAG
jgi:hypothetical protein